MNFNVVVLIDGVKRIVNPNKQVPVADGTV